MSTMRHIAALFTAVSILLGQGGGREEIHLSWVPYIPPAAVRFTVSTREIDLPVIVRDAAGNVVRGLTADDFEVYASGRKQKITSFFVTTAADPTSPEATTRSSPRFIALIVDDLNLVPIPELRPGRSARNGSFGLQRSNAFAAIAEMRRPLNEFLQTGLQPGDRVSIFGTWEGQLAPFSTDISALTSTVNRLTIHSKQGHENAKIGMLEDIVGYMASMPGSRVILVTALDIPSNLFDLNETAARALKAGVVINTLDAKGLGSGSGISDNMSFLAGATGGRYFHNNNNFEKGVRELGTLPEVTYRLAFSPDEVDAGRYRSIRVRVTRPARYSVQARPGYYEDDPRHRQKPAPDELLSRVVLASQSRNDLTVTFSAQIANTDGNAPSVAVTTHVDVTGLRFLKEKGRREQTLTVVAALMDSNGNYVVGRKGQVEFALTDSTFQTVAKQGIPLMLVLPAPAGHYDLRMVACEESTGRMSAVTQPLDLR